MDPMDDDTPSGPPSAPTPATASTSSQGKQPALWELEPDLQSPSSLDAPASQQQLSKRRRGIGVVTPNACNECRKKRVKCDGRKPCGRCRAQRNVTCVYELPVRQSKEDLRNEIENLRRRQRSSDSVLSALARPELWEEVLQRLHGGQSVDDISEWLDGSVSQRLHGSQVRTPTPGILPPPFGSHMPPSAFAGGGAVPYTPFSPGGVPTPSGGGGSSSTGPGSLRSQLDQQQSAPPQDSPWGGELYPGPGQSASTGSNSHQDWTPSVHSQSRVGSWADSNSPSASSEGPYRGLDQILVPATSGRKVPASSWTNITNDSHLVQHLLALYFCWEYPTFASLSKEHFLQDFQDGCKRYCSSMLVNALLALGCRFSTQPNTRSNPDDPYSSGNHFFKECQRLLHLEADHHSFTTIQALGIMSIREASCGRDSESWYYAGQSIRLAIEMGLHLIQYDDGDEEEAAVQAATFWGAFALDHAWSLATGSLPQCSYFLALPPKPAIIDDIEASLWIPYTDGGTPLHRSSQQPSNVRSVYTCFCDLSELVHRSLYILHTPGRPLVSRSLLSMYTQYLNWYDSIPEALRLGRNFTPAVLFAHMYYHFAILLLFRPLIKLRIIGSTILPRDVCLQAADAIQGLLRSYSQLYTLQRTPSFVPYFVLTASIMHLAIGASSADSEPAHDHHGLGSSGSESDFATRQGKTEANKIHAARSRADDHGHYMRSASKMDPRVVESINRGIADLTEMVPCHHFAEQALSILRFLAKKWNIDVHVLAVAKTPSGGIVEIDHDRAVRPLTTSLNFFAPNMGENDFNSTWGSLDEGISKIISTAAVAPSASLASSANTDSLENPLFWPFPMQGRPMLESGEKLEAAGFALL